MRILYFSLLLWCFSGCTQVPMKAPKAVEAKLVHVLNGLESNATLQETRLLAHDIVWRAAALNREFGRTTLPKFHNFLVNIGLKKKGLCYHYSDGLYTYLKRREAHYPHFGFHLIGAHIGSYWMEHNALAVTRKGGKVLDGIVVDAWRQTGTVYAAPIREDKKYKWVHRPNRECL